MMNQPPTLTPKDAAAAAATGGKTPLYPRATAIVSSLHRRCYPHLNSLGYAVHPLLPLSASPRCLHPQHRRHHSEVPRQRNCDGVRVECPRAGPLRTWKRRCAERWYSRVWRRLRCLPHLKGTSHESVTLAVLASALLVVHLRVFQVLFHNVQQRKISHV